MVEASPPRKKADAFNVASKASQRQMLRREGRNGSQAPTDAHAPKNPFDCIKQILPSELDPYEEKRLFSSRMARATQRNRSHRGGDERRPYGVKSVDNNLPLATYDIDYGEKTTLSTAVETSTVAYSAAFKSKKHRFASTPAYKHSSFAGVVKEPYANPEDMGPGTYRLRMHTLRIKDIQGENYTFASHTLRFGTPRVPYAEASPSKPPTTTLGKPAVSSVTMSQTPRFQSDTAFPENYASSKLQRVFYPPDIVYEKPSIMRNTIKEAVATSTVKYGAMTSNADRLMSTAAMVHNIPGAPKLHAATTSALGPGTYKSSTQFARKEAPESNKFTALLPSEHTKDRFGMKPNKNAGFIEARFRRFCTG